MKYTVLDPADGPRESGFKLAGRPESLEGITVGVIENGKKNSDYVLKKIVDRLKERYGFASAVYVKKVSASSPIPPEAARDLAQQCRVVVAGIGD